MHVHTEFTFSWWDKGALIFLWRADFSQALTSSLGHPLPSATILGRWGRDERGGFYPGEGGKELRFPDVSFPLFIKALLVAPRGILPEFILSLIS
jgi:hypothetical protein